MKSIKIIGLLDHFRPVSVRKQDVFLMLGIKRLKSFDVLRVF